MKENEKWIRYIAEKYRPFCNGALEFKDLLQAGHIGLWKAGKNFDPKKGIKFSTYARPYIEGEIKKATRNESGKGMVSEDSIREVLKFEKMEDLLKQEGKEASLEQITEKMDISLKKGKRLEQCSKMRKLSSFDRPIKNVENEETTLGDIIPDKRGLSEFERKQRSNEYDRLQKKRLEHQRKFSQDLIKRNPSLLGVEELNYILIEPRKSTAKENEELKKYEKMEGFKEEVEMWKKYKKDLREIGIPKKLSVQTFQDYLIYKISEEEIKSGKIVIGDNWIEIKPK